MLSGNIGRCTWPACSSAVPPPPRGESMRNLTKIAASAALAACMAMAVGPALADPVNGSGASVKPKETDVVSVGADTNEYLIDQLAFDYNKSHKSGARLYSWDALNPVTNLTDNIKTKFGCAAVPRPNGATAGLTTFYTNAKTSDGKHFCIDYVRSARGRSGSDPMKGKGGVVFVTLAKDAITYAANATTNVPANLTISQLNAIYTCTDTTWTQVGGSSSATIKPFLPQTGSGLRNSFLKDIGVSTPGSCVNSSVQQNEGTDPQFASNPDALVPYSVAKWIAQRFHSGQVRQEANRHAGPVRLRPARQFRAEQHQRHQADYRHRGEDLAQLALLVHHEQRHVRRCPVGEHERQHPGLSRAVLRVVFCQDQGLGLHQFGGQGRHRRVRLPADRVLRHRFLTVPVSFAQPVRSAVHADRCWPQDSPRCPGGRPDHRRRCRACRLGVRVRRHCRHRRQRHYHRSP